MLRPFYLKNPFNEKLSPKFILRPNSSIFCKCANLFEDQDPPLRVEVLRTPPPVVRS